VWARGTDGTLFQKYWDGSAWSSLGGGISGAPTVFARSPGGLNVHVRGLNSATYGRIWGAGGWGNWSLLDATPIESTPTAYSDDPNRDAIVARSGNGLMMKSWTAATGWGAWTDLGPIVVPAAVPAPGPSPPAPDSEVGLGDRPEMHAARRQAERPHHPAGARGQGEGARAADRVLHEGHGAGGDGWIASRRSSCG
jgi:hypothetical protein